MMQDKLEALSLIDLLASSEPGSAADPAHIDLFADTIVALSGIPHCSELQYSSAPLPSRSLGLI